MEGLKFIEKQFPDMDQLTKTGWSWGATTLDFDNDTDPDLYITNGNMSKETAKDYCTTYWRHDVYTGRGKIMPSSLITVITFCEPTTVLVRLSGPPSLAFEL